MTKMDKVFHAVFVILTFISVIYLQENVLTTKTRIESKTEAKFIGITVIAIYMVFYYSIKKMILSFRNKKKVGKD